jgi:regulatory protein
VPRRKHLKPAPPLNPAKLDELALAYVGRYATSRAKLRSYLARKLRERGWDGAREPEIEQLAERFAELGYIDDSAFALARAEALAARGYGKRRLTEKLWLAGIGEEDSGAARGHADAQALAAALRFAERRRIGPFGSAAPDPKQRDKAISAMIRAGHSFALAREIASLPPGVPVDIDELSERFRPAES